MSRTFSILFILSQVLFFGLFAILVAFSDAFHVAIYWALAAFFLINLSLGIVLLVFSKKKTPAAPTEESSSERNAQ